MSHKPLEYLPDNWISLVYAELFLTVARVMTRFDIDLFETVRSRDVDVVRDCIIGLPSAESPGIRVKIKKDRQATTP